MYNFNMETVFWENLNINNFNIFIRDLSSNISINLKHMIEDLDSKETNETNKENINKNRKQKHKKPKKKDLIIQQQNELRNKKRIEDDIKIYKQQFLDIRQKLNNILNNIPEDAEIIYISYCWEICKIFKTLYNNFFELGISYYFTKLN